MNENRLFVVGGTGIPEADLRVPDSDIMFRNEISNKQRANFIPNGNTLPIGVALLYKPGGIEFLELREGREKIIIDQSWKDLLKRNILDLIVFGRRAYTNRCDIFEEIFPQYRGKLYMLRDFDQPWKRDLTLNRCTSFRETFVPYNFRLGKPTPNKENDCSLKHYDLDGRRYAITPELIRIIPNHPNNPVESCKSQNDPVEYQSMITDKIIADITTTIEVAESESCGEQLRSSVNNRINNVFEEAQDRLKDMGETVINEWETNSQFDSQWLISIDYKYPNQMPTKLIRDNLNIQNWFVYSPITSKYKCKICSKYSSIFPMD